MAPRSSILAWKIPWAEEPGRLQSTGPQRVGHDWVTEHIHSWFTPCICFRYTLVCYIQLYICIYICVHVHTRTKSLQSWMTFCDPVDCSPPGPSVHGVLQARILEWIAISSSRGPSQLKDRTHVSCIGKHLFNTEPPGKPDIYIYIYIFFFFHILFSYRVLQDIEYTTLYYIVGPCWLSVLYTVVCIC